MWHNEIGTLMKIRRGHCPLFFECIMVLKNQLSFKYFDRALKHGIVKFLTKLAKKKKKTSNGKFYFRLCKLVDRQKIENQRRK
jgi:hypothetical protein